MKKRVLAADDDASIRESLRRLLEENGYEVSLAADGKEAETRLASEPIDLLVLDLEMPGRDGWDVVECLCARNSLLPVIVITGLAEQLDTKRIPGLDALVEKPIDVAVLLDKIHELLAETAEDRLMRLTRRYERISPDTGCPGYLALPAASRLRGTSSSD
jgi:two-component system response regulator MprA